MWHFDFKKMAKYICDVPAPFMKRHLSVDPVKIDQNVTFATGLKLRGQNIHFLLGGQNRNIGKVRGSKL